MSVLHDKRARTLTDLHTLFLAAISCCTHQGGNEGEPDFTYTAKSFSAQTLASVFVRQADYWAGHERRERWAMSVLELSSLMVVGMRPHTHC